MVAPNRKNWALGGFWILTLAAFAPALAQAEVTAASRAPTAPAAPSATPELVTKPFANPCEGDRCINQNDAYSMAAQQSTYAAWYMQKYSFMGQGLNTPGVINEDGTQALSLRETLAEAVKDCIETEAGTACDPQKRRLILAALMHYNTARHARSMVLQNNLSREQMKSVPEAVFAEGQGVQAGESKVETFTLDPASVLNLKAARDKEILGPEFLRDYRAFINAYTQTSGEGYRYREAVVAGEGEATYSLPTPSVSQETLQRDTQLANNAVVREAVKSENQLLDQTLLQPSRQPASPTDIDKKYGFTELALGMPRSGETSDDPNVIAANIVTQINKDIEDAAENRQRQADQASPASPEAPPISVTVTIDIPSFDAYLDAIWPPSAAATKAPR